MFTNGVSGLKVACSALSYKIHFQLSKRLFSVIIFYSLFVKALEHLFLEENNFSFCVCLKIYLRIIRSACKVLTLQVQASEFVPQT